MNTSYVPGRNRYANARASKNASALPEDEKARNFLRANRSSEFAPMLSVSTSGVTGSVPGPTSVAELARALRYDVDLIFEWVYSNVDYYPLWGAYKGAHGTVIDETGTPFDQCSLMVALLRESGYTANFVKGNIHLTAEQIENWLGTTDTDAVKPTLTFLFTANIPNFTYLINEDTNLLEWVEFDHVWVKAQVDGFNYVFDPSYKLYEYIEGEALATAIGWVDEDNESYDALRAAALIGSSGDEDAILYTNLNRDNIIENFTTYGTNLLSWINSEKFDATLAEIIGGRKILPIESTPVRQLTLPYQTPDSEEFVWTEIPDEFRATYRIRLTDNAVFPTPVTDFLDQTFFTDELHGRRLTVQIFKNEDDDDFKAYMRLDSVLIATSTVLVPDVDNFVTGRFLIEHPFADTSADIPWTQGFYVNDGALYYLGTQFGPCSQAMVDYHQNRLLQNKFDGADPDSESVLGESLAVYYYTHGVQSDAMFAILGSTQIANTYVMKLHAGGIAEYNEFFQGPALDLGGFLESYLSNVGDDFTSGNMAAAGVLIAGALEGGVLQQTLNAPGISAIRFIDQAIASGQTVYLGFSLNWASLTPTLAANNWGAGAIGAMTNTVLSDEGVVIVHENGATTIGDFTGGGFLSFSSGGISDTFVGGMMSGGGSSMPQSSGETNAGAAKGPQSTNNGNSGTATSADPVNLFSGSALYDNADMTVGSGTYPYSLTFSRSYASNLRLTDGPLGLGWTHNFATNISSGSNGLRATGETSAKEGAAAIASAFVLLKLKLAFPTYLTDFSLLNVLIAVVDIQWLIDEFFTGNSITINDVSISRSFVKLVDGTYNPQPGSADTVEKNLDGTFTFKNPQQQTWNFNEDGTIDTYEDPAGVTVTWSYSSGKLQSVSNGLERTISFTYDGDRLVSVSDGNDREISFETDINSNLSAVTDATGNTTVFEYAGPGLLSKIYLPANPTVAIMQNEYDSLKRVKTQTGANVGVTEFFFAGSRSEEVDPLGNSHVMYNNALGSVLLDINALEEVTVFDFDGLNRQVKITLPEGNSVEKTYDEKNNLLTVTQIPKPGSALSNIVQSMEYDPDWNKPSSITDGNGNTTTFEYDATQGTLLTITRPVVDSETPIVVFTYNDRGQVLTRTDETGIVDKLEYDPDNETLLSSIRDFGVGQLNLTQAFGYDDVGNVTSATDANGNVTTFEFDKERRITTQTAPSPFEFVTSWEYDANGWKTALKKQTGDIAQPFQIWSWIYQENGSLKTLVDPANNATAYQYNSANWLTKKTDAENRAWQYTFDALGRIETVTDPLLQVSETRAYTTNGQLASFMDANSNVTSYSYDGFDRLDKRTYPDSSFEQNSVYDDNNNVLTYITRAGDEIVSTFDPLNRLHTKLPGDLPLRTMTYDLAGRLKNINTPTDPDDPTSGDYAFDYDSAGRLDEQTTPDDKTVGYELDASGNRTKLIYPDSYYASYVYDELNRLSDIKLNGSGTAAIHFDYDDLSRRTLTTYENGTTCAYSWAINDDMSSMNHAFSNDSVDSTFSYNKVHQLIGTSVSNKKFVWTPSSSKTTVYSSANNLNQYPAVSGVSFTYDINGNLTGGPFSATFDMLNRMTQVVAAETTNDYVFDPVDRQARKTSNTIQTNYLYDGPQMITEYNGEGELDNRYIRGNQADEIFIKIAGSTKTYLHHDKLGSIIAQTDAAGAVLNTHKYGPFGETPSLIGIPFGFTGQRFDSEVGLYDYKARVYSAGIGRFLQPDPIGTTGGINLYTYVNNNPVNATDSDGLAAKTGGAYTAQSSPIAGGSNSGIPQNGNSSSTNLLAYDWPNPNHGPDGTFTEQWARTDSRNMPIENQDNSPDWYRYPPSKDLGHSIYDKGTKKEGNVEITPPGEPGNESPAPPHREQNPNDYIDPNKDWQLKGYPIV